MTHLPVLSDDAVAVDAAFRAGGAESPLPTRLQVNLGERCNLRCVHCITGAPAKTANGTAAVMGDDVIEALRPTLARSEYLALSHAGEPLLQPGFGRLLSTLREERAGKPTIVHLLSNGVALTEARFVDVVGAGVSSLAVSLEGLSAADNDVVRIGSQAELLTPRLRSFARLRHENQLDVRIGISTVVTRLNVDALDALVEFVADAGLDWLKLEEVFAVDAVAAALAADPRSTARAVSRAVQRGVELGVVVVDHSRPRQIWRCQLRPSTPNAVFAAGDDHANRTNINSCRLPWEQACIEPGGDVRPVGFHHPVAGNLLREEMGVLWNSPACVEVRQAMRAVRPCGAGPTTCSADAGPRAW